MAEGAIPPHTPVLVGVGVRSQREDDPARALDPLALMLQAVRQAGLDAGAPSLLPRLQRVLVPRGRWSYSDPGRSLARAIGAERVTTVLATVGVLQQTLIADACAAIARGEIEAAMVVGGDCGYRLLRARLQGYELPRPEAGDPPDVLWAPKEELLHEAETRAGLRMPAGLYAILESAFRARHGWTVEDHRDRIADLYSRFSQVAAGNPHAWNRKVYRPEEIRSASDRNPMQAFPYTKLHCSSWNVDQASALIFCSEALADEMSIDRRQRVYPWASTESNHMTPVCARADLAACPGARLAGRAALEPFELAATDIDLVELYSCFPVAVEAVAAELNLSLESSLTITGGMPFAGGPFNNYVLQSTAHMAGLIRQGSGRTGLVSSISGLLTKQGFGLWGASPPAGGVVFSDVTDDVAAVDPARRVHCTYEGVAEVIGYSVVHERGRPSQAIVVATAPDGARVVAASHNDEINAEVESGDQIGRKVKLDAQKFEFLT